MKVLFKKFLLNPTITGPIHTRIGTIDFEAIQLEMLEVLYDEGHLEGYVSLIEPESDTTAEKVESAPKAKITK